MTAILYGLIVFLATALGATTGAGGGAIIKPVFDLMGQDSAATISVYATVAVFAMCLSSIYKHLKSGLIFKLPILLGLSIGSVLGGILGEHIFSRATASITNSQITMVQSILLFLVLLAVALFTRFYDYLPRYKMTSLIAIFLAGTVVGALSVFIGIGGGPLNVIVLMGLMSLTAKQSTAYSLAMIFFAQIPKVLKLALHATAYSFDPWILPVIILIALVGGNVGSRINNSMTDKQIRKTYLLMMTFLLLTCLFNIVSNL